jgi:hypothetical protein
METDDLVAYVTNLTWSHFGLIMGLRNEEPAQFFRIGVRLCSFALLPLRLFLPVPDYR